MAACTTHASVIVWPVSHQCLQPLIVVREHRRSAGGIHNARRDIILISVVPNAAVDYLRAAGRGDLAAGKRSVAQPPRNAIHCYHALPAVGAHSSKKRDQRRFTAGKCGRLPSTRFPSFMLICQIMTRRSRGASTFVAAHSPCVNSRLIRPSASSPSAVSNSRPGRVTESGGAATIVGNQLMAQDFKCVGHGAACPRGSLSVGAFLARRCHAFARSWASLALA
jgi:hypothetical protein